MSKLMGMMGGAGGQPGGMPDMSKIMGMMGKQGGMADLGEMVKSMGQTVPAP